VCSSDLFYFAAPLIHFPEPPLYILLPKQNRNYYRLTYLVTKPISIMEDSNNDGFPSIHPPALVHLSDDYGPPSPLSSAPNTPQHSIQSTFSAEGVSERRNRVPWSNKNVQRKEDTPFDEPEDDKKKSPLHRRGVTTSMEHAPRGRRPLGDSSLKPVPYKKKKEISPTANTISQEVDFAVKGTPSTLRMMALLKNEGKPKSQGLSDVTTSAPQMMTTRQFDRSFVPTITAPTSAAAPGTSDEYVPDDERSPKKKISAMDVPDDESPDKIVLSLNKDSVFGELRTPTRRLPEEFTGMRTPESRIVPESPEIPEKTALPLKTSQQQEMPQQGALAFFPSRAVHESQSSESKKMRVSFSEADNKYKDISPRKTVSHVDYCEQEEEDVLDLLMSDAAYFSNAAVEMSFTFSSVLSEASAVMEHLVLGPPKVVQSPEQIAAEWRRRKRLAVMESKSQALDVTGEAVEVTSTGISFDDDDITAVADNRVRSDLDDIPEDESVFGNQMVDVTDSEAEMADASSQEKITPSLKSMGTDSVTDWWLERGLVRHGRNGSTFSHASSDSAKSCKDDMSEVTEDSSQKRRTKKKRFAGDQPIPLPGFDGELSIPLTVTMKANDKLPITAVQPHRGDTKLHLLKASPAKSDADCSSPNRRTKNRNLVASDDSIPLTTRDEDGNEKGNVRALTTHTVYAEKDEKKTHPLKDRSLETQRDDEKLNVHPLAGQLLNTKENKGNSHPLTDPQKVAVTTKRMSHPWSGWTMKGDIEKKKENPSLSKVEVVSSTFALPAVAELAAAENGFDAGRNPLTDVPNSAHVAISPGTFADGDLPRLSTKGSSVDAAFVLGPVDEIEGTDILNTPEERGQLDKPRSQHFSPSLQDPVEHISTTMQFDELAKFPDSADGLGPTPLPNAPDKGETFNNEEFILPSSGVTTASGLMLTKDEVTIWSKPPVEDSIDLHSVPNYDTQNPVENGDHQQKSTQAVLDKKVPALTAKEDEMKPTPGVMDSGKVEDCDSKQDNGQHGQRGLSEHTSTHSTAIMNDTKSSQAESGKAIISESEGVDLQHGTVLEDTTDGRRSTFIAKALGITVIEYTPGSTDRSENNASEINGKRQEKYEEGGQNDDGKQEKFCDENTTDNTNLTDEVGIMAITCGPSPLQQVESNGKEESVEARNEYSEIVSDWVCQQEENDETTKPSNYHGVDNDILDEGLHEGTSYEKDQGDASIVATMSDDVCISVDGVVSHAAQTVDTCSSDLTERRSNETPILIKSIDDINGIAKGDVVLSLVKTTPEAHGTTGRGQVRNAVWRMRTMRRRMTREQNNRLTKIDESLVVNQGGSPTKRLSLPVDVDDVRVVGGIKNIETLEACAVEHLQVDEIDEALELYEDIIYAYTETFKQREIAKSSGVSNSLDTGLDFRPFIGNALHNLGILHFLNSDFKDALSFFVRARDSRKSLLGENHADYLVSFSLYVHLYWPVPLLISSVRRHTQKLHCATTRWKISIWPTQSLSKLLASAKVIVRESQTSCRWPRS